LEHEISGVAGEGAGIKWCGKGPRGGKVDVFNKKNFSPSVRFKLLNEVKNVNKCDF